MSDPLLHGITDGFEWSIRIRVSFEYRFYAFVQVGSVYSVTTETYKLEERAKAAGRQLVADTLAELLDADHA